MTTPVTQVETLPVVLQQIEVDGNDACTARLFIAPHSSLNEFQLFCKLIAVEGCGSTDKLVKING